MADDMRNDNRDMGAADDVGGASASGTATAGAAGGTGEELYHEQDKGAFDELVAVARDLRDDFARLFGASKNLAAQQAGRIKGSAKGVYANGRERASALASDAGEYVQGHPVQSLLIAAGAGILVGFLLRRTTASAA